MEVFMAKKKKRVEEEVEPVGYIVELKGIFLVLIAIVGLCPFGMVADFIKGFSCFLFGTLWALFLVVLGGIGIYTIIKRKQPKIVTGKSVGLFIIIIGVLTLLHISYIEANGIDPNNFNITNDGISVLKSTVDNVMKGIKQDFWIPETGGGIIGAIFVSIFATLLTLNGTWFICFALIVCGLIVYTGLTIFEMMKKTKDEVRKVAGKVHMPKKERKKKVEEPKEEEVVVVPVTDDKPSKKYVYPPISLLNKPVKTDGKENELAIKSNIPVLIQVLMDFGIEAKVVDTHVGPAVTQYELEIKAGTKVSKILSLNREIALALAAKDVRIQAPIPGKSTIGIELPNRKISMVSVREVLTSLPASKVNSKLLTVLGRDIMGEPQWMEINKTPHLLVAGATGSGKSVCINSIIASILMRTKPDEVKLVLVDPKKVEFSVYSPLENHFLAMIPQENDPIITDVTKVVQTLKSLCQLMDHRYDLLKKARVRNIKEYNAKFISRQLNPENGHEYMPYIVVIIDEFGDLIMTAGKEVELPIARIAQLARAVGMHMVIATQRPTTNIITGTIKANFPARMAFRVISVIDSRTILDRSGANQLQGRGDMLFLAGNDPVRVQCALVETKEVERVCAHIAKQQGYQTAYILPEPDEVADYGDGGGKVRGRGGDYDWAGKYGCFCAWVFDGKFVFWTDFECL